MLAAQPFSISVSIDGATKATFEALRRQSNFAVVHANLRRFHAHARDAGTCFSLSVCLMSQNWHEMVDILRLAEELDCDCFINTVTDPVGCSLYALPEDEQRRIADALEQAAEAAGNTIARNRAHLLHEVASLRRHAQLELRRRLANVRRAPLLEEPVEPMASPLLERAWKLLVQGRHAEALEALRAAEAAPDAAWLDPVRALHFAAQLTLQTGDALKARERFKRLLLMRPGHPDFRIGRAWAAQALGAVDFARSEAAAVLCDHPDHAGARHLATLLSPSP